MRIGVTGTGTTVNEVVEQAQRAERDGFSALWYASVVTGDPMVAIAMAGRATTKIELGTAVLQTYPCHPVLQAQRAASVVDAMGRAGFTLGIGPSHRPLIEGSLGLSYAHPGRNTEEYIRILVSALRGETLDFDGSDWSAHAPAGTVAVVTTSPVPVLVSALGPRLLRVAGGLADGAVSWLAPPKAIETHIAPRIHAAAKEADRPAPRIVAGLPVAVHDDADEARAAAEARSGTVAAMENYQRILRIGDMSTAAEAALVGSEASVRAQLTSLIDAGATDIWAAPFPVGEYGGASLRRTTDLLREMVA